MATRDTYETQTWENLPAETTPVNAERLTHIEQGIKDAVDKRALKKIYDDIGAIIGERNNANNGGNHILVGYDNVLNGFYTAIIVGSNNKGENGGGGICSGNNNIIRGSANFVSGQGNEANEVCCGAIGEGLTAVGQQTVVGRYNIKDWNHNYAFIVGGGANGYDKKNIHTIDWAGNVYFAGDVTNGVGVSLNSLKSAIDNLPTGGGVTTKVFDTKADLDAWLAVEGNADTLVVGQNIYIKATDTPDYWWDGTGLQILETDKVVIESMTYDETMAILNATAEGVA